MTTELLVRQGRSSDIRCIFSNWLKSYRDSHTVKGCPNTLYYRYQEDIIKALLPTSGVLVLCDATDEDHILGWLIYQRHPEMVMIHYMYVKHPFRKRKLATHLVNFVLEAEANVDGSPPAVLFTHKTKAANEILHHYRVVGKREGEAADKTKTWVYDPYRLWVTLPQGWWRGKDVS